MKKIIYLGLVLIFAITGCKSSSNNDQAIFDEANQLLKDLKYPMAVVQFEKLVKEFPKSDYYPKACMELGNIYNAKLITTMSPEANSRKAVYYYNKIYKEFPVSTHAEQALFLTGFIYANELKNMDSAKTSYNLFLEKFPNSQMASSVKAELQNLGKAPEEIIK